MKNSGRSLKRRLSLIGNKISRAKHFRGYGVHSPFVYGLVRKVFMSKALFEGTGTELFDALRKEGFSEKRARQLHNAMYYAEAKNFSINSVEAEFAVLTREASIEELRRGYQEAKTKGAVLVIGRPYHTRERQAEVWAMIEAHTSTSVDNRSYIIFFNNRLPKQHYRL